MISAPSRLGYDPEGLNTAMSPATIAESLVTPADEFFTRSHTAVPKVDPAGWRLEIGGLVRTPLSLSLDELVHRFPRREVAATIVCAGLRRVEFLTLGPLPGELAWGPEPASTGRWTGVALRDVLLAAGVDPRARHAEFTGLDQVERHGHRFGFGGSIDLDKALGAETLLAHELNGAPLPPAHGFPLRAAVPGWIGARSVKWLTRIELIEEPSANYFQTKAYRVQREADPLEPRSVERGQALSGVPLNSVILDPAPEARVAAGSLRVRGWAMGSSGRPLTSIEVSADGGRTWVRPSVTDQAGQWTWTFWEATVRLPPGRHELVVRAGDQAGRQPASVRDVWNVKGYGNNAWHRVAVTAE